MVFSESLKIIESETNVLGCFVAPFYGDFRYQDQGKKNVLDGILQKRLFLKSVFACIFDDLGNNKTIE